MVVFDDMLFAVCKKLLVSAKNMQMNAENLLDRN